MNQVERQSWGESDIGWGGVEGGGCTRGPGGLGSCRNEGVWCHYQFGSDRPAGALMKGVPLGQSL